MTARSIDESRCCAINRASTAVLRIIVASELEALTLWCDARQDALAFYEKLGFDIDSRVFIKSAVRYQKASVHPPYPNISLGDNFKGAIGIVEEAKKFFSAD